MSLIIGVGGSIKSGKTSLALGLARRLPNATLRAFGDVVRAEARARGRDLTRQSLQTTGSELVAEGWPAFVSRALDPPINSDVAVVDGVRHVAAFAEIRAQLPDARAVLLFADPPVCTVHRRLSAVGEQAAALAHPVEAHLGEVRLIADLVLGGVDVEADLAKALAFLS